MSLQSFERDIEVDDWTTSVPPTSELKRNTVENAVGIQLEISPHHNHNNHMNVCPRAEQSTAFQVFNTSGNNDPPSGTSSPPYPPYNNVHATSLLRPEQFLPTPDHISSFMSTEFPLIQHNTLSTICPEKFQSNIFQHNTRDFQCANFVSLCLGYVSSE
ncbi:hypothetical protein ACHAO8_010879 [Botrytis cinerea]